MNLIKIGFVVLLLLNNTQCATEKKSAKPMIQNPSEIIIYVKKDSDLTYDNGFRGTNNLDEAKKINKILQNYEIIVKKIGSQNQSKTKTSNNNGLPSMFSIIINVKDAKQVCDLLNSISIIDGAYIKPDTEEPSMDY